MRRRVDGLPGRELSLVEEAGRRNRLEKEASEGRAIEERERERESCLGQSAQQKKAPKAPAPVQPVRLLLQSRAFSHGS